MAKAIGTRSRNYKTRNPILGNFNMRDYHVKAALGQGFYFVAGGGLSASQILAEQIYAEHSSRVLAEGGVIESEAVTTAVIKELIEIYGVSTIEEFKAALPLTIDPTVFGYKIGAGSLSTLGFAANKLYSPDSNYDLIQSVAASQPALLAQNDVS